MLSPLVFSGEEGMVDRVEKGDEVEDESIAGAMARTVSQEVRLKRVDVWDQRWGVNVIEVTVRRYGWERRGERRCSVFPPCNQGKLGRECRK